MKFLLLFFIEFFCFLTISSEKIEDSLKTDDLFVFLEEFQAKNLNKPLLKESLQGQLEQLKDFSHKISTLAQDLHTKESENQRLNDNYEKISANLAEIKEKMVFVDKNAENSNFFEKLKGDSKLFTGFLKKINEKLEKTSEKFENSLSSNAEKKELVFNEIETFTKEIATLKEKNVKFTKEIEGEKVDFEGILEELEKFKDKNQDLALEIKKFKGIYEGKAGEFTEKKSINSRKKAEFSKEEGKLKEIQRKIANLTENKEKLLMKKGFLKEMVKRIKMEKEEKNENLREIHKKIKDFELKSENSMLEIGVLKSKKEGRLEELKGKSVNKLKKIDEDLEEEKRIEVEKREKIEKLEELKGKIKREMKKIKVF